jgi:citrate lyase subunit beta / citryl-CoA lyase
MLRSLLFVPADSERKLAKAKEVRADALVLDLEDAVAPAAKAAARRRMAEALQTGMRRDCVMLVRVSGVGSETFRDDCEALGACLPDGIMLSKCRSAADVLELAQFLSNPDPEGACAICPLIETAGGLLNAYGIACSSERVFALGFGAEDFSAEIGVRRTEDEVELLYARSALVIAARAAGCEVFDSPCITLNDEKRLASAAARARNLGFSGKIAIHPEQVPVLNAAFSPTEAELAWARRTLESSSEGGVGRIGSQMVDEAVLRQARRILRSQSGPVRRDVAS